VLEASLLSKRSFDGNQNRSPIRGKLHKVIAGLLQLIVLLGAASCACAQDVTTWHYDNARSGVQSHETLLTPANVTSAKFGKLFSFPVLGDLYAQPLYLSQYMMSDAKLHNVLLVATAQDYVYAFDADGKNPSQGYLWRKLLVGAGETWLTGIDGGIGPNVGIIATPVISRSSGIIYVLSRSKTTSGTIKYFQRLHALNIADGTEKLSGPATIQAAVPGLGDGGTTITFNALIQNQRPALLLAPTPGVGSGNSIFLAWASHGDHGAYHGWVMAYDAANVAKQNGAWVDTPNGREGGIWMSGGGPSSDNSGNIFIVNGNGTFNANNGGKDYGSSAFRLTVGTSGITLRDYFTPADALTNLNPHDQDMGTGAMTLLPTQSGARPHLAVTVDKTGAIYLINRDHMGGFNSSSNTSVQSFSAGTKIRNSFAFFNNIMYGGFDGAPLQAWSFNPTTGLFNTTPQSKSPTVYGCNPCEGGGTTPSVSASGSANAIVWGLDNSGFFHKPAILHAYDATNLAKELYNSTQAANSRDAAAVAVKFTTPTIANGHVYVGGRNAVTIYGMIGGPRASTPTFSPAAGTYSSTQTVSILDSTPNASIYYSTTGPASPGSTLYTGPIQVASSKTISAIAIAPGFTESPEGIASYTIGSTCSAPTTPGVHVCKPVGGSTVPSPVQVQAHATITGTLARMEVWVDGVKKYTETTGTSLSTSIALTAGAHTFHVYAVNTAGTKWLGSVSATVQ
jgi:hypothetical protein